MNTFWDNYVDDKYRLNHKNYTITIRFIIQKLLKKLIKEAAKKEVDSPLRPLAFPLGLEEK